MDARHAVVARNVAILSILTSGPAWGQTGLPRGPGEVAFETSCPEAARSDFNHAVTQLHHMTYSGARAEFEAISAAYPSCAMAHWGIAMTLFQPLWPTRPTPGDLRRGWEEVRNAERIATMTAREKGFVAAARAFFDPRREDYWERIDAWITASRQLAEAYPEDREARAMYALALLAAPAVGDTSRASKAVSLLESILLEQPTHPGAIHYMIHANDAVGREGRSLDVVRSYAAVAPENPHALHMPTHIFTRLGQWPEVVDGNRRAADAALKNPAGDAQQWVSDEFPHAIEYLVYALLQQGDDSSAFEEMRRLQRTPDLQPTFKTAFHLSSTPARYMLERRDWVNAARLEPRPLTDLAWEQFPWPEAVTWFARGIGAARSGDLPAARTAEARLAELRDASKRLGEDPFARQTEVLRLGVAGWAANLGDDRTLAMHLLEAAVDLETSIPKPPVTPAPTIPASELLGDLLLEADRPADALRAYEAALASAPNRFGSLLGAARAARQLGDVGRARAYYGTLREIAVASSTRPELAEAMEYLNR